MAIAPEIRTVPTGARTIYVIVDLIGRAMNGVSRWNARRATRNALYRLNDRELADIGLTRSDIGTLHDRF